MSENGEDTVIPAGEVEVEEKVEAGGSGSEIFDTEMEEVSEAKFNSLMEDANDNYIEALVATSRQDYNASEEALNELVENLNVISDSYVRNPPEPYDDDELWPETVNTAVNIAIDSRQHLLRNDIEAAHEALEPMRELFYELHTRNELELMGDRLTEFHTVMETATEAANEGDTVAVVTLIPELKVRWQGVINAEPPEKADENYETALENVELKINELETAATFNDEEETREAAEELRQAFTEVFVEYGVVIA